jgi:hypothetical protein
MPFETGEPAMTKPSHTGSKVALPHLDKTDIDVFADLNGSGGVKWSHVIKTGPHDNGGKIKLPKGLGSRMEFDLKDNTGLGIRFDASAPFFVREGNAGTCPSTMASTQCMVDTCDADHLTVIDWNYGLECDLHYQLNFVTQGGAPVTSYDPIIQNGGGGVKPS